jgi:hypothetical protein
MRTREMVQGYGDEDDKCTIRHDTPPSRLELQSYPKVIDIDKWTFVIKTDESKQCTFVYQALAFPGQKFGAEKLWPLLSSCPRNLKELLHYTEHRRDLSTLTFCIKAHSGFLRV